MSALYTDKLLRPGLPPGGCFFSARRWNQPPLTPSKDMILSGWWLPPKKRRGHPAGRRPGCAAGTPCCPESAASGRGGLRRTYPGYPGLRRCSRHFGGTPRLPNWTPCSTTRSAPGGCCEWVGALGFSVGGTTVLRAPQRATLDSRRVIAEGNYANLRDEITFTSSKVLSPQWQAQRLVAADVLAAHRPASAGSQSNRCNFLTHRATPRFADPWATARTAPYPRAGAGQRLSLR